MAEKKKSATTKKKTAKKSTTKKAPAKKTVAKKSTTKKAPDKKTVAKKTPVKKTVDAKKEVKGKKIMEEAKNFELDRNLAKTLFTLLGGIIVGILIALIFQEPQIPTLDSGEELIAKIDGYEISNNSLYETVKDSVALNALLEMIDTELLTNLYEEDDAMKEYVDEYVNYYKELYPDTFNDLLIQSGFEGEADFKEYLQLDYRKSLYAEEYSKELVTDSEIEDYYNDIVKNEIRASHILIEPIYADGVDNDTATEEETEAAEQAAYDLAADLITQLNEGADFAELAKEYSNDGSASNGGDLDFFRENTMTSAFEEAAYALEIDEYTSEPVETVYGYHIILKTDEKEKDALEDVKEEIVNTLASQVSSSDANFIINALIHLRETNGFTIYDDEIEKNYKNYISLY